MNEIRKVINWAQQAPASASAANTPTGHQARQRQLQQPFSPSASAAGEMSLAAEDNFVDDGYGTALFASSSGGSRSRGASAAGAGLPGPQSDGLPLMLEDVQLSIPASQLAARKRSSDGAGSCRGSIGDGDGMVSVTAGSGGSRAGSRHNSSSKGSSSKPGRQWAPPEVDVSVSVSGLHEAQEGSCYQDTQQLYSDSSRVDVGSDCSRWVCSCIPQTHLQLALGVLCFAFVVKFRMQEHSKRGVFVNCGCMAVHTARHTFAQNSG
jgi:hypothetical protein